MNELSTEIMSALAKKEDVGEIIRQAVEQAVNGLLKTELTAFLGYQAYQRPDQATNYRNGVYERQLTTKYGEITVQVPRDRAGQFEKQTIERYQRRTDSLEDMVIHLYRRGITTKEIAELMEKMYGSYYTPATMSNITQNVAKQVERFHHRKLADKYAVVYVDATYVHLRRDTVENEAVYIMIGIRPNGRKEVLNYTIAPTESKTIWEEQLQIIKGQGVQQVLLFVADGVIGLTDAVAQHFPKAKLQRCLVHVARNFTAKVRVSDRKPINDDFRDVRQSATSVAAKQALTVFIDKWGKKYPSLKKLAQEENLFTYYAFPKAVRHSIYSTNLIESFNKVFKANLKKKQQFPNEDSLARFTVTQCLDYNDRYAGRTHRGFASCRDTFDSMFE